MTLRTHPSSLAAAGAMLCGAVAMWVSFGAVAFLDTHNRAPYVGLLPSPVWLAALLLLAAFVTIVARPTSHEVEPLWLSAVLLLPWLPFRLPQSVFIWTGNVAVWLWAAIGAALLLPAFGRKSRARGMAHIPPRRAALLAGALSAVAFGLGTWSVAPQHPDGDEPHYLVITQSILGDRDLKIENNHRQRDYRVYVSQAIKPDFIKRGTDGEIYSIHAPGLSLLVAPAFALLGYPGVLVALVLVSAAASALAWLIAWRVSGDAAASWFAWAAVTLSVPFFFHAAAVFPDGFGAVLMLVALLPLVDERAREPQRLLAVGAALAFLPWLSSRFVVLSVMSALVIAARLAAGRTRLAARLAALAICPALSGIAFLLFFQIIYGTPNPSVVYGDPPTMSLSVGNLARGVPGMLFDQQFGLIPNAPVSLCGFVGIVVMLWRGPRRLALELLLIAVPYFLVAASFTSWWGGTTAPARYLVPIALLLVVPTACWFATATSVAARSVSLGALFTSLLMTVTMAAVDRGAFVFNFRDGMSRVALWLSPVVDLTKALPSLFQNPPSTVLLQTAVWLAAIALAVAAAALLNRRSRASVILGFGLALEVAAMAAVSLVWRGNHVDAATPASAGAAVLERYRPDSGQLALAYRPFHRVPLAELPEEVVLARTLSSSPRREWSEMTHLPPAVYQISGTVVGSPAGHIRVRTDPRTPALAEWDVAQLERVWKRELPIPVAVAGLQIDLDGDAQQHVRDLTVRAASVVPRADRPADGREAGHGARYGSATVFTLGGTSWVEPEGIWVGGAGHAEFVVRPDQPGVLHLFVRNGRVSNEVTLVSGAWRQALALGPGEEQVAEVPTDPRRSAVLLRVASARGFRPSTLDSKTEDDRFLGVWIATR